MKTLLSPNAPCPWKRQYPLKPDALEGLRPSVSKYWDIGILITCESPCNTPILSVKKPNGSNQFIQDLRAVNEAVVPIHPMVPNPYTLLFQVQGNAKYFSFLDLKDAFYCIPLHPESQNFLPLSGGTWEQGRSYNFAGLDYHKGLETALIFSGLLWGEN